MEKVIHYILSHNSGVTNLVGTSPARIFPVFADWQASVDRTTGKLLATIVYHRDDTTMELDIRATPELQVGSFIIDYYAETFVDEMALGDAIFSALHGANGTYNGVTVTSIKFQGRSSLDDAENEGRFIFHGQQVYKVAMKI